ncbi:MAG TPA: hypothetical protein V6C72_04975 [Chroococcales cyanobacterium]
MRFWRKSYKAYSIGLLVAWGIALSLIWHVRGQAAFESSLLVFAGYFLGWVSTTIARNVYPKERGLLG